MKKLSSIFLFTFIALIFAAFSTQYTFVKEGDDKPNYETAKKNFWETYQNYKAGLDKDINRIKPVDPSGLFYINDLGNFDVKHPLNQQTDYIAPHGTLPDLVSTYAFSQSTTTFTSIVGGSGTVLVTSMCDDSYLLNYPIGFTFNYNSTPFTAFCVSCNGWATLGATGTNGYYTPLCSGTPYCLAPFANDLYGTATGNGIYYQTTGTAPNRVLTIEWAHWGFYSSGLNEMDFQIKLFESTNIVQFVYKPETVSYTQTLEVGIMGASAADFNTRTETSGWSSTTAGTACSTCSFSPSNYPANGLTFQWAPPAPPPVPVLSTPANHTIGNPVSSLIISWAASSGATNYNLQIALDSLMTSLVYNDTTLTGISYSFSGFTPLTNWWWRVRAKNANGWSAFSIPWTFKTMGASTTPVLLTPANNATNQPIALSCVWNRAIDQTDKIPGIHITTNGLRDNELAVSNYWFELYTDTTTAPVIRDSTLTDTTKALTGLLNSQNYWWKVKGKNPIGWGSFSAYYKFTTVVAAPPAPNNIYPLNNATGIIPTTLIDWSYIPTASQYRLQVSTDINFATAQMDTICSKDSCVVPAGKLLNNTLYYWRVRSENAGGNSAYGPTWNFTTSLVGISNNGGAIPKSFNLYQAYPNPFNPVTTIRFDIPKSSDVNITVFNTLGQEVATLVNGRVDAGSFSVAWDAANFSSGVYFYRITAGDYSNIHKMVLLK